MEPFTLIAVEQAFGAAYGRDTCAEDDLPFWSATNPSRGHCAVAALTINDLLGGDLLVATVETDGKQTGYHWWNRLNGVDLDMTRTQFLPNEVVGQPDVLVRPQERPKHYADQYDMFRSRVFAALELPD